MTSLWKRLQNAPFQACKPHRPARCSNYCKRGPGCPQEMTLNSHEGKRLQLQCVGNCYCFPTLSCWFPHCHFRCCLSPVAKIARPVIFIDTDTASQVVLTEGCISQTRAFKKWNGLAGWVLRGHAAPAKTGRTFRPIQKQKLETPRSEKQCWIRWTWKNHENSSNTIQNNTNTNCIELLLQDVSSRPWGMWSH